jgi:uncharacterized protein HemY
LARQAVALRPDDWANLNTLGVVLYRLGEWNQAREMLERSLEKVAGRTDAFDLFFLAMSHFRLGDSARAWNCYDRAVVWVQQQENLRADWKRELDSFRAEAQEVLGQSVRP